MSKGTGSDRALRMIFNEANNSDVGPGLHTQDEELDELIEQLQLEYNKLTCAEHKIWNLGEQSLAREANLELTKNNVVLATKSIQQITEGTSEDTHIPIDSSL